MSTAKSTRVSVQPAETESLVGSASQAMAAGIPVISCSFDIAPAAGASAFVGSDEVEMGREQARLVVDTLVGEGNLALMTGILGTSAQVGRSQGQHEILDAAPGITVVDDQPNDWAPDKTLSLIQDWLAKYPEGELDAVVAHGPELVAAAEYAKSQGRDEVVFVALDYPEDARAAIQSGTILTTINQSPVVMAELAKETARTLVDGGTVEPVIHVETPVITLDNVEGQPAAY